MNTAEKLRFLADRLEDGKGFCIEGKDGFFRSIDKVLFYRVHRKSKDETEWNRATFDLNDLKFNGLSLLPQWSFTEDEKVILRNISEQHKWITRDKSGDITIYSTKPYKSNGYWVGSQTVYSFQQLTAFKHLFQSIQWSDDEPCEFRKYL